MSDYKDGLHIWRHRHYESAISELRSAISRLRRNVATEADLEQIRRMVTEGRKLDRLLTKTLNNR